MSDASLEAWMARLLDEAQALWAGLLALGSPLLVAALLVAGLVALAPRISHAQLSLTGR